MSMAALSWSELNPEYEYVYYTDTAMRSYVTREARRVPGLREAFALASSGAAQCDLWRYLVTYAEGGVYVDMDAVLRRPLREVIRPSDDAVSGVGHKQRALEQWILAYRPGHPILRLVLKLAVQAVLASGEPVGRRAISLTGPDQLYRATLQVLGKPPGFHFESSTARQRHCGGARRACVTVLPGTYVCSRGEDTRQCLGCCGQLDTFGGNAYAKYPGYFSDLKRINVTWWMAAAERR